MRNYKQFSKKRIFVDVLTVSWSALEWTVFEYVVTISAFIVLGSRRCPLAIFPHAWLGGGSSKIRPIPLLFKAKEGSLSPCNITSATSDWLFLKNEMTTNEFFFYVRDNATVQILRQILIAKAYLFSMIVKWQFCNRRCSDG